MLAALVTFALAAPAADAPSLEPAPEAAPAEIAPDEVAPVEATPVEAAPVEAALVEAAPAEAATVEPATVASAPVEAAPAPAVGVGPSTAVDRVATAPSYAVEAFTARRGFRMATAGTALMAAGVAWIGIAGWMLAQDDPRSGLSLAFVINGSVATTVGVGLAIGGAPRARHPATWIAKKSGRRARMDAAARDFEPHLPTTAAERNVVAKGTKLRNYGFMSLTAGVGLVAFGTGMQFAYGGDSLALKIVVPAVSVPFVIAGGVLLGAGGRRIYSPHRFTDRKHASSSSRRARVQLAAAPTFHRGSFGVALSGRF